MKVFKWLLLAVFVSGSVSATDQFSWMRDDSRSKEKVINYLNKQNDKTNIYQDKIRSESESLLKSWQENRPTRSEKPWREIDGFEYSIQTKKGGRVLLSRVAGNTNSVVLFDIDTRAKHFDYYQLGAWALNSDRSKLAIAEDTSGSELYQVKVIDLNTREVSSIAENVDSTLTWSADDQSLFLIELEEQTARPYALTSYSVDTQQPTRLYHESDMGWLISFYLSSDRQFAVVQSNNEQASEQRLLNLVSGELSPPILPREEGKEYYLDVQDSRAYINSNHARSGFGVYSSPLRQVSNLESWKAVFEPDDESKVSNFYLFDSGTVVISQKGATQSLHFFDNDNTYRASELIAQPGQVSWVGQVGDFKSNKLHIRSMSMTQPAKWERLNTATLKRELLSQDQYPHYQESAYHTEQITVNSDGAKVPVTLAYRKDTLTDDSSVLLYGYGAYGMTMKPYFMPQIISLLDKGVIYAIAHVRGGGFYGEFWYQAGKGLKKGNGVQDFVASAQGLKEYRHGKRPVYAMGASAGGTLVAAALNQAPDAFSGAVLKVPFVDVVNSMSDTSLPLTAQQYGEWGNPNIATQLEVMKQYDPYLNLSAQDYPPVLVQVGFNDRRVPYWEGAKYFEKLKSVSSGKGPYLLSTQFNQGHSTDRRNALSQQAFEYAFLLSLKQQAFKAEQ
ncbi:prolyl oligopeptidase family serine peptidase [Vibrio profundi]|uniref:prolyl oligopeptidase family serine peptidase n=1 Tax=Vibrio profundi TaxID=1774960 RepID=UPI003736955D